MQRLSVEELIAELVPRLGAGYGRIAKFAATDFLMKARRIALAALYRSTFQSFDDWTDDSKGCTQGVWQEFLKDPVAVREISSPRSPVVAKRRRRGNAGLVICPWLAVDDADLAVKFFVKKAQLTVEDAIGYRLCDPLRPYEIRISGIPHAGFGCFARRDLDQDSVVGLYGAIFLPFLGRDADPFTGARKRGDFSHVISEDFHGLAGSAPRSVGCGRFVLPTDHWAGPGAFLNGASGKVANAQLQPLEMEFWWEGRRRRCEIFVIKTTREVGAREELFLCYPVKPLHQAIVLERLMMPVDKYFEFRATLGLKDLFYDLRG